MSKKSRYSAVSIFFKILLIIATIVAVYIFMKDMGEDLVSDLYILNRKPIIVQTDTMEPYIKDGSMVVIKKAKMKDLKNHDVIAYYLDDRIVIHRIFIEDGAIKTKADTSSRFDLYEVNDDNLIGHVSLRVNVPIFKFLNTLETEDGVSVDDVEI